MGCDIVRIKDIQRDQISIHAPTWGATTSGSQAWLIGAFQSTHPHGVRPVNHKGVLGVERISIHAPTWGATATSTRGSTNTRYFNPRTHMGCDRTFHRHMRPLYRRALAPPTWGATTADQYEKNCSFSGTRATHMGCDWLTVYLPL